MQVLSVPQLQGHLASIAEVQDLYFPIGTGLHGEDGDHANRGADEKLQAEGVAAVDEVGIDAVRVGPVAEPSQEVVNVAALHHFCKLGCKVGDVIPAADAKEGVKIGHVHVLVVVMLADPEALDGSCTPQPPALPASRQRRRAGWATIPPTS